MKDTQIISAIQNRDERAINHAINKYSKLLWPVVKASLAGYFTPEEAEECVADVFIYLWQNPEKFDPRRGKLKSWLCIVARSRALDRYRSLSRHSMEALDTAQYISAADVADKLITKEELQRLNLAVLGLKEPDREIILRRYFHEQKPSEIALAMDVPLKLVENRLYRAKLRLREALKD